MDKIGKDRNDKYDNGEKMQMKITAGLGSIDEYERFVHAGADEFFCGYVPYEWTKKYGTVMPLNRREVLSYNVQIGSLGELEILAAMVKEYGKPVHLTFNALYYIPEQYPEEHCLKAPEMLREAGVGEDVIHSVISHGYGITVGCGVTIDVEPEHEMEKVLFAADELTGLIWAAALMRPSKSTKDMELKSLKKKYKSKGFAAGCSREVIQRGADQLGWDLAKLLTMTLEAMAANEDLINAEMEAE